MRTNEGGDESAGTISPVTIVRPSGEKATSAVATVVVEKTSDSLVCVRASTKSTLAYSPPSPITSLLSSALNAMARIGLTIESANWICPTAW